MPLALQPKGGDGGQSNCSKNAFGMSGLFFFFFNIQDVQLSTKEVLGALRSSVGFSCPSLTESCQLHLSPAWPPGRPASSHCGLPPRAQPRPSHGSLTRGGPRLCSSCRLALPPEIRSPSSSPLKPSPSFHTGKPSS